MPFLNFKNLFSSSAKLPKPDAPPPILGLDVVGRGITLKPHQAYELKKVLFKRTFGNRIFHATETGKTYAVPEEYEVSETHPVPANQALDEIVIEESWEHFDEHFNLDAHVAASYNVFSVDAKVGQAKPLRFEEDYYCVMRTFFIPFWTLYLPDVTVLSDKNAFPLNIPTPFQYKYRREYDKFFERYGTHYIKRAWIGGKARLVLTIAKSAGMTKQDIRKSFNTCDGSDCPDAGVKEIVEQLQNSADCVVFAQGGESATLSPQCLFDNTRYNDWLATVRKNPKVVEFDAAGIWTLISDKKKAKALLDAYFASTVFTAFSAIFSDDCQKVYFIRGKECTCYNVETRQTGEPKLITDMWPSLLEIKGFETVDAVLKGAHVRSKEGRHLHSKLFFFKENQCVRLDIGTKKIDEGYPKPIAEQWPGVTFERIDAILSMDCESVYFFMEDQYIRYNIIENEADSGQPPIEKEWVGLTFDRIDAAIAWKNGIAYFFRGNEYICYDTVKYCALGGYPKFLVSDYVEDWNLF
jgi:hypothetical protein